VTELANRLSQIEQNIQTACRKAGRAPSTVKVLLATKTVESERLREAARLGYTLFGENRAQELLEKIAPLADLKPRWDFIGHLQTNKVKDIISHCALIHSVDRLTLAEEISKRAGHRGLTARVLIEVNTSGEDSKSGIAPAQALALAREISMLPNIAVEGLMTLAENTDNDSAVRACFRQLRELSMTLAAARLPNIEMRELSMGMSQDYVIAVEEGATLLRLGSVVFGARDQK